jgi:hypothetical protein
MLKTAISNNYFVTFFLINQRRKYEDIAFFCHLFMEVKGCSKVAMSKFRNLNGQLFHFENNIQITST